MSTEINKLATRRFHEGFDKGDFAAMEAVISADVRSYYPGAEDGVGFDGFKATGQAFIDAFSQSRSLIQDQVAEGDRVATRLEWSAVHTAPFNGIPPTNRPVRMQIFVIDRFENGKIVEHRAAFDVMGLLQQLGAVPAAS